MTANPGYLSTRASSADTPTIQGEGLRVTYRGKTVLEVDSISLAAGETFALLGSSGAGKSTLLRVLGMLERPTAGRVLYEGEPANGSRLRTRRTVAAVFQKPYLLRGTVADNVGYGLRLRRVPAAERVRQAAEALERVGLAGWQDRSALTLSGGEAQRVALARALVLRPRLLLLDEPLSYLDPLLKRQLSLEFARILADEAVTALYVTHDQDEAAVVADRIGVMREGRIVAEGDPESVLTLPNDPWVASFLGTVTSVDGVVESAVEGTLRIRCGHAAIYALGTMAVGASVRLGVRPEDVLLFEPDVPFAGTPARNRIEGVVTEVSASGVTVRVVVDLGGARISSSVSRSSAASLKLAPGAGVTAMFKSTAVRVVEC
ncbi:MAG: ABC transporter ATP-binding protein [Coriobacteriia bacterium]|nr:ABC transporter ATP-binding protein [Coriobacteriia bacterium]